MPRITELTEATAVDADDLFLVIEDGVAKKIAAADLPGGGGSLYSDEVLSESSLVSYWRLGEASGAFIDSKGANDSVGVGAGITRGEVPLQVSDYDSSVGFNGSSGWIQIADHSSLQITGALSIEALFRLDEPLADESYHAIVAKYDGGNTGGYELELIGEPDGNAQIGMTVRGGGSAHEIRTPVSSIIPGVVYHVIASYHDATNTGRLRVNGVENGIDTNVTVVLAAGTGSDLNIGARGAGAADPTQLWFPGLIDEVAIYSDVLSEARQLAHYAASRAWLATRQETAAASVGAKLAAYTFCR